MSTALTTLSAAVQGIVSWTVSLTNTGFQPKPDSESISKKFAFGLGTGAGLANEVVGRFDSINASSSLSIDLTSQTDPCGQTVDFSAIKGILVWLVSATDTTPDGTANAGSAASGITIDNTVTNALSAQSHSGWFDNAAEGAANGSKFTIPNGGFLVFGLGNAGGITVDSTHKIIKITNLDAGVAAKVVTAFIGLG